ncbi:MAG: arylformamidase [Burkholderiales bacterium]|nr:arylformamidase [Burkholderiales bacterium]
MKLWDISPPVDAHSPVFPGDTPYHQHWVATLDVACPVNVSAVTLSPHVGAHADAPLHYDASGAAVGELSLAPYLGPCRVIHVIGVAPLVRWAHIEHAWPAQDRACPPRILLRTCQRQPRDHFDEHLTALDPALVEALADRGVVLIGIDSASVDPAASKELPSHQVLRRRGLRVLENLLLDDVAEGDYELIALPLRWTHADASPVRAILRELPAAESDFVADAVTNSVTVTDPATATATAQP